MTTGRGETSIHWFRKGMRLHDNPAFKVSYETRTSRGDHYVLRPVYVLDPHFRKHVRAGANRWRFLQQSLADLDASLRKLGTRLYVVTGVPEEVFSDLFVKWNVKLLTFEVDTEPYARVRDERVERLAEQHGVKVERAVSHTIYNTAELVKRMKPPFTYGSMVTLMTNTVFHPREPISAPCSLPTQCLLGQYIDRDTYTVPDFNTVLTSGISNPDDLNTLPPCLIPGGETVALSRLNDLMDNEAWVCGFEKPKTSPNSLQPSTTVLSPYLKFGCLSASLFYHRLREVEAAYRSGAGHTAPPVSLVGQLYWREFYYAVGMATPNFDKMVGNPICVQVPWDDNPDALEAWTYGRTGYPFIDAIMRQLRAEGWVHHLARHAVACFLTRGDLWISWEKGLAVFEELLLDADWSMNAGNWMWVSASAFFHQFYRVYSPVAFGKKTDKNGDYIRKYVPELAGYPSKYIYEPWMAPRSVQLAAGCVVGEQYPKRVVVHEDVYKANIAKMSLAYKATKAARAIAKSSDDASGSSSSLRNSSSSPNKKKCKKTHSPEQL